MQKDYSHWNAKAATDNLSGETSTLCIIIEMVLGQAASILDPLEDPAGDSKLLFAAVHTVKNVCGVLCATLLVELASEMQRQLQDGETASSEDKLAMAKEFGLLLHELLHFHGMTREVRNDPAQLELLPAAPQSTLVLPSNLFHPHAESTS